MGTASTQPTHLDESALLSRLGVDPDALRAFCTEHQIQRLAVFGSVLRGTDGPDSDVDLLVDFEPGQTPGLIGMARLEAALSGLLGGRRVDLRTRADLSCLFRDQVVREAVAIHAAWEPHSTG